MGYLEGEGRCSQDRVRRRRLPGLFNSEEAIVARRDESRDGSRTTDHLECTVGH